MYTRRITWIALATFCLMGLGACGTKGKEYRDLSGWPPIEFDMDVNGTVLEIKAHRIDATERSNVPNFIVVEGSGTYRDPDSDDWILLELRLYLPKRDYNDGEKIQINATKSSSFKDPKPYLRYSEYRLDKAKGSRTFDLGSTASSSQEPAGTVRGEVVVDQFLSDGSFEASFSLQLVSDQNKKRAITNGFFRYEPSPAR